MAKTGEICDHEAIGIVTGGESITGPKIEKINVNRAIADNPCSERTGVLEDGHRNSSDPRIGKS